MARERLGWRRGQACLLVLITSCLEAAGDFDTASLTLQDLDQPSDNIPVAVKGVFVVPGFELQLYAGVRYAFKLTNALPDAAAAGGDDRRMRVCFASAANCNSPLDSRYVAGPWGQPDGAPVTYADTQGGGFVLNASDPLQFLMGGQYRLCFAEDGDWAGGSAQQVPLSIQVKGVYDYISPGLLAQRRYYCYLKRKSYYGYSSANGTYTATETSCRVWFGYSTPGNVSAEGAAVGDMGSWSAEFTVNPDDRSVMPKGCGTAPATFICNAPAIQGTQGACGTGIRMVLSDSINEKTVRIPAVTNTLDGNAFYARAVAACYCSGFMGCTDSSNFLQQVGVLLFFISKVCDGQSTGCLEDFTGVTPQYRFRMRVQCPTNECRGQSATRLKLVMQDSSDDLPSWMANSGCRTAVHGLIRISATQSVLALAPLTLTSYGYNQPFVPPVTPLTTNPANCNNITGCPQSSSGITSDLGGYQRQDYKEFGGDSGFQFMMGSTNHEARNFYQSYKIDVCYCNQACNQPSNWFKAGAMRLSPTRLVSSATAQSNLPAQWGIEFVKQPGIVGLYRSYDDEYTLGLKANGMLVKIVRDMPGDGDQPSYADYKCWTSGYDPQLVSGPSDQGSASFNYAGTTTPPEAERIIFNSGFVARTVQISTAGRVAICYCGVVDDSGLCANGGDLSQYWKLVTYMSIKGPKLLPQQLWTFSTNITFRFSYVGYGLSNYDKLRIIDFSGKCDADNYNPNKAAYEYTFLRTGCPVNCNRVTLNIGTNPGDLTTRVRTADCWTFDRNNQACQVNDIQQVVVLSPSQTELTFQKPHGFKDGDEITMGDNIFCDPQDTVCTPEALNALKGVYSYQDVNNNDYQAPETYMSAHKIVTVPGFPNKARIHFGWPSPAPKFTVIFKGRDPNNPLVIGRGGFWTHHSQGFTQEEVMGETAKASMKVCWSYGRSQTPNSVKYVEEVGQITIIDPAVMDGATLSLSTTKLGQAAPMVLQFRTAGSSQIGLKYDNALDSLRLKIVFTKPQYLDMHYTGLTAPAIPYNDYVLYEQASQQTCGLLFLELWSEDMERGFPLPRGCYFRSYAGANPRREMEMVFEKQSGLRKNTIYQIVFNGHIQDVLDPITYELAQDNFMQVIPMDDVTARPYEAIERGDVQLHPQGPIPKRNSLDVSPEFSKISGFKIIGGYNNLLELRSGDSLAFDFMGGAGDGVKISAGCLIRIYLWPFTQWQTTSSCTAGCVVGGEASFLCNYINCQAEAVVPGMTLNIIKLTLGTYTGNGWNGFGDLYGPAKVRVRIGAVTMPAGGFFAERLAAQVTNPGDNYPNYVISVGDLIWKAPSEGQTVAKVIGSAGGGNTQPFRQQTDNILYARLMLSATLLARDDSGQDASFTITLPLGYTCKQPPNGLPNAWEAPNTLPAFGTEVPQGRGTPDDGTVTHGWTTSGNNCTFKPLHPFGVIYAGSSVIIKITADNPTFSLPRNSPANMWTMKASSRGLCGTTLCIKQGDDRFYKFLASPDPIYQSNYEVLGRISRSAIQPSNFALRGARDSSQAVRVFFQTEQQIAGGGQVLVNAPPGFNFGSPCQAKDLEDAYYAVGGDPTTATLPLPVDDSLTMFNCTTMYLNDTATGLPYQRIMIKLQDILEGGRYYGFQVQLYNPTDQTVYGTDGWRIFTADSMGFLVDGTPATVPFLDSQGNSWSVYATNTTGFRVSLQVQPQAGLVVNGVPVLDMRPYVMTNAAVYFSIILKNVPQGDSGMIRVTAPDGYRWNFSNPYSGDDLIFRAATDPRLPAYRVARAPAGITQPFPPCVAANSAATSCPITRVSDTILTFPSGYFSSRETYGFAVPLRVPPMNPTTSSNAFFIELGYTANSIKQRKAAAFVPVPDVRALRNAVVSYTTSIVGKETSLQFQLQTVTDIPIGGFLQIMAPLGFNFSDDCYLMPVSDPYAPAYPPLDCRHTLTSQGPRIRLKAATAVLKAGRQAFAILADNPRTTGYNFPNANTPCGTDICWMFNSFRITGTGEEELDYGTSARGYNINSKMIEARIPPLTSLQTYATMRDDRPLTHNNVIFAFQLTSTATQSGKLVIRGPYGFSFAQECSAGVQVSAELMFGLGNRFPDDFTVWPSGVLITSCRGAGPMATLTTVMNPGSQLKAATLYLIRVGNLTNPLKTPDPNNWALELTSGFSGEASEPITGMELWAFTDTRVTPIATERDQTLAGEVRTVNPLRFLFRPHNTIPTEGTIRADAPDGFQFVAQPSRECDVQLRELPYVDLGVQYPGYVWPQATLVCLVDDGDPSKLKVRLRDPRPVTTGLQYELILFAYNSKILSTTRADWILQSYLPGDLPLDESRIPGFIVNQVMSFKYSNPDPSNPGQEVLNGNARLPNFALSMQFPDPLQAGDKIEIMVPTDFTFTDPNWRDGRCLNFRPVCLQQLVAGADCVIPLDAPVCNSTLSTITFYVTKYPPVPQETQIMFGIDLVNPARTMPVAENFWRCTHYGPSVVSPPDRGYRWREDSYNAQLPIRSSKTFQSWTIVPQMEQVAVDVLQPGNLAASSTSGIVVHFVPVNDAEDVAIEFVQPSGFDFTGAVVNPATPPQTLLRPDTGGALARVRTTIVAGVPVTISIQGVTLGLNGGQTYVRLTSWTGGLLQNGVWKPGTKQDERLDCADVCSFILPGLVDISYDKLENQYQQNPSQYPVQSRWEAQMGRPAMITFRFSITQGVKVGQELWIFGKPYAPTMSTFSLAKAPPAVLVAGQTDDPAARAVKCRIKDVLDMTLKVTLDQTLAPFTDYEVGFSVIAPSPQAEAAHGGPIRWTIETWTFPYADLPTNTNDGNTREFQIVEEYQFSVTATRAPPTAEVVVSLVVKPGLKAPTALVIVAPLLFNFTAADCLVYGGAQIISCAPAGLTPDGRATAKLICQEPGLMGQTTDLRIKVTTPAKAPLDKSWFVEGRDEFSDQQYGWGQATGIDIDQMAETVVEYPGIPGLPARMVWKFQSQVLVEAGGWLQAILPEGFSPSCDAGRLQTIALPATGGCKVVDSQNVIVYLNSTITPGTYAFAFSVIPPSVTPSINTMSLVLKDSGGHVQDAAVDIMGMAIQSKLKIRDSGLQWTSAKAMRSSVITLGFEAVEPLPDLVVAPDQQVSEVLIVLPGGFTHLVSELNDFTLMNEDMPLKGTLRGGEWLDFMQQDRLRITLNLNRTSWTTLKTGKYEFRFPVLVPAPLPTFNVWHVCLCSPTFPGGCSRITDPAVLLTFPMPGFQLGQMYGAPDQAVALGLTAAAPPRRRAGTLGAAAAVAALGALLRLGRDGGG